MSKQRSDAAIDTGLVMTVLGPIDVDEMGVALMHEHLLVDARSWWHEPKQAERRHLAEGPVRPSILGELRMDPFVNPDNCSLDDEQAAIEELALFSELDGRTVVDPTCRGIGRDPDALVRISRASGLHLVMGAGYYLEGSHPAHVKSMSIAAIAEEIERDAIDGVDGSDIKIGLIGEIGVSADFTSEEEKVLRAAARASATTGLPLMVHLPGWERHAHRVLDITGEEGAKPEETVLCHMNPSFDDQDYQISLAERGAFIEYDMIGMDFYYADQDAQCPSDTETARAIKALIDQGWLTSLLLSQDVFLKMMLTRHGGFGYGYVMRHYLPRLRRLGVTDEQTRQLMVGNPKRVFSSAHRQV